MSEFLLQIDDLSISLPMGGERTYAVEAVSLNLSRGEILCVVGESGSGKSMVANAIMGLLSRPHVNPTAGHIYFQGQDLLTLDEEGLRGLRGRVMGMIFQEPMTALNPVLSIGRQLQEVFEAHGERGIDRGRIIELLSQVGLPRPEQLMDSYPFRLSGGQRQRVMIALALALEPALLIADEPTTALDVTTQAQILALIRHLQRERDMGVLFITHDFGVVADIADRVMVMQAGRIVEVGTASEVLNRPRHDYTRRLIRAVPHLQVHGRPPIQAEPLLVVEKLVKRYGGGRGWWRRDPGLVAVDRVSFTIANGETVGLVGESGSGKSTVGRCLVRLLRSDGGSIRFQGQEITTLSERSFKPLRRAIQMIFQDPYASLNPRQTVARIITQGPIAHGVSSLNARRHAEEILDLVGLDASALDRYPHEFSGGQRQRIGIARALVLEPQLLVADEAVSALDVSVQAQVLELLADIKARLNLAMLFITHDLRVAAQICDRIAVMQAGEIVEYGDTAQVFAAPQHEYTRELLAAVPGRHWDLSAAQALS